MMACGEQRHRGGCTSHTNRHENAIDARPHSPTSERWIAAEPRLTALAHPRSSTDTLLNRAGGSSTHRACDVCDRPTPERKRNRAIIPHQSEVAAKRPWIPGLGATLV